MNKSIIVVGPLILDKHYFIDEYPKESNLADIRDVSASIGGSGNLVIDLAKLDSSLEIKVISVIGKDKEASTILEALEPYDNIDLSQSVLLERTPSTLVMNSAKTKQRTFFYDSASNDDFCIDHINLNSLEGNILQVEYIGLVGSLMDKEKEHGSYIAKLLYEAQKKGIKTSIDMVSKKDSRTVNAALTSLKYTDYCTVNEIEAETISGISVTDESNNIVEENVIKALDEIKRLGVSTWVVIHSRLLNYGLDCKTNKVYKADSLNVPKSYIKGTTGAGDAFLSGILISIQRDYSLEKALKVACSSAVCSLAAVDGTSAMKSYDEVMKLFDIYGKGCVYKTIRE